MGIFIVLFLLQVQEIQVQIYLNRNGNLGVQVTKTFRVRTSGMDGSRGTSTVVKVCSLGYAILWIMWLSSFCALCLKLHSTKADLETNI